MILRVTSLLIANILFLYLFWRRLREDYTSDAIFTTATYVVVSVIISQVLSAQFFPGWWFWVGMVFVLLGLSAGIRRFTMRPVETAEALFVSAYPVLCIIFLYHFVVDGGWLSFSAGVFSILLFVSFFVIDKHYKKLSWYQSGKIGFAGFTTLGVFFLVRAMVATQITDVISFSGKYEVFLSAIVAFFGFLEIFTLSR